MKQSLKTLLSSIVILLGNDLQAAADKPLLMDGKKSLYQRVLSVPDAHLYQATGESSASTPVVPFSVLYVYAQRDGWIKVGYASFDPIAGWVKQDKAIVWNQALTVSFKDPQDIQRVMLFSDKDALEKLVNNYDKES